MRSEVMVVMSWFLLGAAVGLLAHRVFPGRTPVGRAGYVVAGVLGAELAGVTFAMVTGQGFGRPGPLGLLTSAAGAVVVIGLFRAAAGTRDGGTRDGGTRDGGTRDGGTRSTRS